MVTESKQHLHLSVISAALANTRTGHAVRGHQELSILPQGVRPGIQIEIGSREEVNLIQVHGENAALYLSSLIELAAVGAEAIHSAGTVKYRLVDDDWSTYFDDSELDGRLATNLDDLGIDASKPIKVERFAANGGGKLPIIGELTVIRAEGVDPALALLDPNNLTAPTMGPAYITIEGTKS